MTHRRQQILERVETLVTGLSTTGSRVTRSMVYALDAESALPAINVQPSSEQTDGGVGQAPRVFTRRFRIEVNGYARAISNLDQALNQIALEIEQALAMPVVGPWNQLSLLRTDISMDGSGEKPVGQIRLTYEATYLARENSPT